MVNANKALLRVLLALDLDAYKYAPTKKNEKAINRTLKSLGGLMATW